MKNINSANTELYDEKIEQLNFYYMLLLFNSVCSKELQKREVFITLSDPELAEQSPALVITYGTPWQ